MARIPTPIEPLARLGAEWGVDLCVKRDDLTGCALSGNKIRKLDYLLAEALRQGCDTVVTCGATTSNHARATVLAARQLGLDSVLVLTGQPPAVAHGNLQLDLLAGAEVRYVPWETYATTIDTHIYTVGDELAAQGKKPYMIPTGGSNALGLLGYFDAVAEMKAQWEESGWTPDWIVCAVGSGGTFAGLYAGGQWNQLPCRVLGVLVCATVEHFTHKIQQDLQNAERQFGLRLEPWPLHLTGEYIAGGYAKTDSAQLALLRHVAQREGLILEPVYTGKAFYGLYQEIQAGRIVPGAKVLFIHTGGLLGLSAFTETMMSEWPSLSHWPDRMKRE
jgi:D-cysteine desulfhydrase